MVLSAGNKKFEIISVNEGKSLHFIPLLLNKGKFNNLIDYGAESEFIVQRKKTQERGAYIKCHLENEIR